MCSEKEHAPFDDVTFQKELKGEWKPMNYLRPETVNKHLWHVLLVHEEELQIDTLVVARTAEQAKLKAGVYGYLDDGNLDLEEVTVFCNHVGPVRSAKKG